MHRVRRLLALILALTLLLTIPAVVQAQDGERTHVVQAGENLYRISLQYSVTMTDLAVANNITNPSLIFVGQVLVIPGTVQPVASETPVASPVATEADTGDGTEAADTPEPTDVPPTATDVPVVTEEPTEVPEAPAPATTETVYVVQPGDNLFRIALKYNMTTAELAAYNGITNPNIVVLGQSIRIPPAAGVVPVATPVATPIMTAVPDAAPEVVPTEVPTEAPTEVPMVEPTVVPDVAPTEIPAEEVDAEVTPPPSSASNVGFAYGIEVHLPNQNASQVADWVDELNMWWVKQEIEWALYEPTQGTINWTPIDDMLDALDDSGLKILLTVTSAPAWARDSEQEQGPPTDYASYASFVGALAERYQDRVEAIEVWSEPNLRREWNTPRGISPASYVEMLRLAYVAIKNVDPSLIVVTGGLAPTGFNDGVNAIDDRIYLRQMYAAGVADWSDAIGAHPNGWANPPDSTCCRNNRPAVPAWDDHPSFFFKETLQDYREIMVANGDSGTYIWPTEFGWGSNDGLNVEPAAELAFVTYTNLDEQAQYIVRGFQLGRELGYVGPMFLWNLNFCPVVGVTGDQCLWSLVDPAGNPRPAYLAVRDLLD